MALIQDSKFCMRTDGRVSENNATGGPNSSADNELGPCMAKMKVVQLHEWTPKQL